MPAKTKFERATLRAIHSSASYMFRAGTINKATMRHFDETCLTAPAIFAPVEIELLRESNNVSQPVFARYLNTSDSTVEKWQTGTMKPSGTALKLPAIV